MRKDFVHHYSETGYRSNKGRSNPNPRVQSLRNQKPTVRDLYYDEQEDQYDLLDQSNLYKHVKSSPMGVKDDHYDDGKYYRYSMINRFLRSQVGRDWNEVLSDICESLDDSKHSYILKHNILNHVQTQTFLVNGKVCCVDYRGNIVELKSRPFWRNDFYVHPQNGKLCSTEIDHQKTVPSRSQTENRFLHKRSMLNKKKYKRDKKHRLGEFKDRLGWRSNRTNISLEEAMNILKEKKNVDHQR